MANILRNENKKKESSLAYKDIHTYILLNKCLDRSMKVKLPVLLDNYDRQTNQPTKERRTHREVSHPISSPVYAQN